MDTSPLPLRPTQVAKEFAIMLVLLYPIFETRKKIIGNIWHIFNKPMQSFHGYKCMANVVGCKPGMNLGYNAIGNFLLFLGC